MEKDSFQMDKKQNRLELIKKRYLLMKKIKEER